MGLHFATFYSPWMLLQFYPIHSHCISTLFNFDKISIGKVCIIDIPYKKAKGLQKSPTLPEKAPKAKKSHNKCRPSFRYEIKCTQSIRYQANVVDPCPPYRGAHLKLPPFLSTPFLFLIPRKGECLTLNFCFKIQTVPYYSLLNIIHY